MADIKGVCLITAPDLDTLVALAEGAIEEGWLAGAEDGLLSAVKGAARRGRSSLSLRVAAVDNDRFLDGKPTLCRLQPPGE